MTDHADAPGETTLIERDAGGVRVSMVYWDGENGLSDPAVYLSVDNGETLACVRVPDDRVLDAFAHPSVYLDEPLELFGNH